MVNAKSLLLPVEPTAAAFQNNSSSPSYQKEEHEIK